MSFFGNKQKITTIFRFCSRLLDYPGPEKEQAKAMLRELRSRKGRRHGSHVTNNNNSMNQSTRTSIIHTRSKGPIQK